MNREQAIRVVTRGLDDLVAHDRALLSRDVSERAITHKLAQYIERRVAMLNLDEIDVDCEYNRNAPAGHRAPKTVQLLEQRVRQMIDGKDVVGDDDYRSVTTYPDIIIHRRGTNERNLLVIEVKKSTNRTDTGLDAAKLAAFTENTDRNSYHYRHGLLILLNTGVDVPGPAQLTWFSNGHREE